MAVLFIFGRVPGRNASGTQTGTVTTRFIYKREREIEKEERDMFHCSVFFFFFFRCADKKYIGQ